VSLATEHHTDHLSPTQYTLKGSEGSRDFRDSAGSGYGDREEASAETLAPLLSLVPPMASRAMQGSVPHTTLPITNSP
jgi:hypothetical protein